MGKNNMQNNMMQDNMMRNNMQNNMMRSNMMHSNMMRNNYRGSEAAVGSGMDSSQTDHQTGESNSDCGDESFCKFTSGANGFCESCSSIQSCNNAGFMNQKSQMSCSQVCESENDENNNNDEHRM